MNNLDEFRIEQPSLVQALDKYREMEKVLEEEYDSLRDTIIQSSNEWQGATSETLISEMEYFLNEGDYNTAYENVKTMRMCMEDTLEQVNALLARSEEFPKQLQSNTYIEPMRPAMGDNTVRNGGVIYLDYGKARLIPGLCDQVYEAAEYLGNVLKQHMEVCSGIMDGIPTYISRVDEAVEKVKRIENYKFSFQKYVQDVMVLENDVAVRLAGMKTVQSEYDSAYDEDNSVICRGETVRNVEYAFLDFINGTTIYYNEETLLSSLEQMYRDGYFPLENHQYLRSLIIQYSRLPSQEATIMKEKISVYYNNYELLKTYVSEEFLEQLEWTDMDAVKANYGENFIEELRSAMMKAGIVSEVSIKMFLVTITHESGWGLNTTEVVNPDEITGDYKYDTRGAGFIQLTEPSQISFFKYLDDNNIGDQDAVIFYYNMLTKDDVVVDSMPEGLSPTEYIAKYYPIESAVWFWGINVERIQVSGQYISINEYVELYSDIESQEKLFVVTQMATTGSEFRERLLGRMCEKPEEISWSDKIYFEIYDSYLPNNLKERLRLWYIVD